MIKSLIKNKSKYTVFGLFLIVLIGLIAITETKAKDSNKFSYEVAFCQTNVFIENIDQAVNCNYDARYNPLKAGFGETPRWLRIQISTPNPTNQLFAIQVRPFFLREINFYSHGNSGWSMQTAGSHHLNVSHNEIGGHFFITAPNNQTQGTYYIQTQATSIASISVSVIAWPNPTLQPSGHLLGIGAQIGILGTIFAFSLVSLIANPTIVMARFNAYIANLILCILSGSGILALYVFKQAPLFNELLFFTGLCLKLGLWVWLAQAFLREYTTPRWYKRCCWALYGLVATSIALGFLGKMDIAILLILIGYTFTALVQIIATIKTPSAGKPLQTALITGFGVTLALIYLAVASVFFPLESNSQIPLYLARLTDFVNPLVMLSIIVFQNRLIRKELVQIKNTLTETQLRAEFESKLLKDRRTLIDMLAHELKNPLASIGLASETLSQSIATKNDNDQKRLQNINHAILSMDTIIERCSLINAIDQGPIPLNPSLINICSFTENLLENAHCKNRVNLLTEGSIEMRTDSQFLKIILTNLIENGLKYSPADSPVRITIQELIDDAGTRIRISLSNFIQKDFEPDPRLLFKRFYRHPLAKQTRGSGLGLSICKELCNALSGTIQYRLLNNEVTFILELPK
ncbi:ATP-binding protein [Polynucleobacter sp. MWH-UH23A]|uniref:ATP-binding protein n=1 Tax=Polynucleobacter sp. MWH-UH23A TaxID=1855613 RepID=UPI003364EC19